MNDFIPLIGAIVITFLTAFLNIRNFKPKKDIDKIFN